MISKQKIKHYSEYLATKFLVVTMGLLPEKFRFKIADGIASLFYHLIKRRRLTALANINLAFPDLPKEKQEKIAKESFKIMVKAVVSSLYFDKYLKDEGKMSFVGMENVQERSKLGNGVMVALMHMGNMEASLKASDYFHLSTVAKSQRNPYLDNLITQNRLTTDNITLIKKSKNTTKELIKAISKKEVIALFCDHRDKGAEVTFFGKKTIAPTGPMSLAIKYKMPVFLCYNILRDDNTCYSELIEVPLEISGNFKEDVLYNTQKLINYMEEAIKEHPEQWMWFHDRWKLYKELYRKPKK